jgi:Predicted nucleotide-binding protein containing TIR-like domain
MAKKTTRASEQPEKPMLAMARDDAELRLQIQIDKGKHLLARPIGSGDWWEKIEQEYFRWDDFNFELLKAMFNTGGYALQYRGYSFGSATPRNLKEQIDNFHEDVKYRVNHLESLKERLGLIPEDPGITRSITVSETQPMKSSNKVFVVHGHDDAAKIDVARFLEKLDLDAIILHERSDLGQTNY